MSPRIHGRDATALRGPARAHGAACAFLLLLPALAWGQEKQPEAPPSAHRGSHDATRPADPPPAGPRIFYEAAYEDDITGDAARAYARYGDALRVGGLSPVLAWRARARRALLLEHLGRPAAALEALRRVEKERPPPGEHALWALVRGRARRLAAGAGRSGAGGPPAAHAFDRLASPDPAVRYGAIAELKRLAPEVAIPETIARTADENPKIRHYAVILAGHFGDRRALGALRARLLDPVWDIRCNAARALFKLGDTRGRGTLVAALTQAPIATRRLAAFHLVEMDDPAGARVLVGALSDPDAEIRARALGGLMRLARSGDRGFDPQAPEPARATPLARWQAWLAGLEPSDGS